MMEKISSKKKNSTIVTTISKYQKTTRELSTIISEVTWKKIYTKSSTKEKKPRQPEVRQRVFMRYIETIGPCIVLQKISPLKYKVRMNTSKKNYIVHIDNVITRNEIQSDEEDNKIDDSKSIITRTKKKMNLQ